MDSETKRRVRNGTVLTLRLATPTGVGLILWYLIQLDRKLDQVIDLLLRVLVR